MSEPVLDADGMDADGFAHCLVTDCVRGVLYGRVNLRVYLSAGEKGQLVASVVVREARQIWSWDMTKGRDAGLYGVAESGLLPTSRVSAPLSRPVVVTNPSKVIACSAKSVASFQKVPAWARS